jgi:hypothetical protein
MGFTYIDTLTGSLEADNKPAIKMDIPVGNDSSAAGTKYFELQRYKNPIFYITKEGSVFAARFTGSVSGTSTSSSYLIQTSQNTTKGVAYYDGSGLKSADGLIFDNNTSGVKSLSISSSLSFNYLNVASRGLTSGGVQYNQSAISLFNLNSSEAFPNRDGWIIYSNRSGSLTFTTPIGSYEISNSNVVCRATANETIIYGMVQRRNGFYFWPYMAGNTPARDGAIGIGVQPPNEPTGSFNKYLRAKLQINMFSGSGVGAWSPQATVEHRSTAILVNYGSGSTNTGFTPTFYVSSSGNTYAKGWISSSANYYSYGLVGVDGPLYTKGGKITNVNPSSDERLKTGVQPVTYGLNEVSNLNPVTFYWTEEASKHDRNKKYGFIAQQVSSYMPDLVGTDEDGYYNLDTFSMIPILVKAIKELKAEVDDLKSKLP